MGKPLPIETESAQRWDLGSQQLEITKVSPQANPISRFRALQQSLLLLPRGMFPRA